jgi:hypothetical protein
VTNRYVSVRTVLDGRTAHDEMGRMSKLSEHVRAFTRFYALLRAFKRIYAHLRAFTRIHEQMTHEQRYHVNIQINKSKN